jgi:group I intron endonuclease
MEPTAERRAGIYMIRNEVTGDRYYGSSVNLRTRSAQHSYTLRRGVHRNRWLQYSWNKYGETAFTFAVLAVLERADVLATEQRLLNANVGSDGCMNLASDASAPMLGRKHSSESRAKTSARHKGRVKSAAECAAISAAKKGVPGHRHTPETRAKMSASLRASSAMAAYQADRRTKPPRVFSEQARANIAAAQTGKTMSPEARARMSAAGKGKRRTFSPEHCAAIAAAATGRVRSPEMRARMSAAMMGNVRSPESLAKRSASLKATFARKRAERAA